MTSIRRWAAAATLASGFVSAHAAGSLLGFEIYTDAGAFLAATGNPGFESFETIAARVRGSAAVVTAGFKVTPEGTAQLGVQTDPETPETGHGSGATEGTHYLFSYLPPEPGTGAQRAPGTLRFDFHAPVTGFAVRLTDLGEAIGNVTVQTNVGPLNSPETVLSFPSALDNGTVSFFGITQTTAFTSLSLTVTGLDEAYGLDQVYIQSVPEPEGWALLAAGLIPVIAFARRRRQG
jgi:hypothetical protein